MAAVMNSSMNSTSPASALGIPEGARRASEGMPRAAAAPDPEVVATARRRQFSAGEQRTLLAGRELAAPGGRDNLRVGCRRGPGHPFTRPTGSLRDAQGRSRGSAVHRRVHYCCHLWILPLDTKLPKAVVPGHIGTQGRRCASRTKWPRVTMELLEVMESRSRPLRN